MRLRPSGRSGPLATQIDGFLSYQEHEAWTWEHMALTRARVISGPPEFAARVEAIIREVLCRKRDAASRRSRRGRDARGDRQGERRRRSLGPQIRSRRAGRYRIHRAISAARAGRRDAGHSRHLDGADAGESRAAWRAQGRGRRGAAACGDAVSQSRRRFSASACRANSIRLRQAPEFSGCLPAPPTCRISPRCRRMSADTQRQVRECFVRILGTAP